MNIHLFKDCSTYWVKLYLSGPIEVAKQIIRREALERGMCVTIDPTSYIYTGGEEVGYVVGFVNYPRFPKDEQSIWDEASQLGCKLRDETFQHSFMIMDPHQTRWYSTRENAI